MMHVYGKVEIADRIFGIICISKDKTEARKRVIFYLGELLKVGQSEKTLRDALQLVKEKTSLLEEGGER